MQLRSLTHYAFIFWISIVEYACNCRILHEQYGSSQVHNIGIDTMDSWLDQRNNHLFFFRSLVAFFVRLLFFQFMFTTSSSFYSHFATFTLAEYQTKACNMCVPVHTICQWICSFFFRLFVCLFGNSFLICILLGRREFGGFSEITFDIGFWAAYQESHHLKTTARICLGLCVVWWTASGLNVGLRARAHCLKNEFHLQKKKNIW